MQTHLSTSWPAWLLMLLLALGAVPALAQQVVVRPDSAEAQALRRHLRRPMPLYVRYATCTAENGRRQFLADTYGRDEALRRALFGPRASSRGSRPVVAQAQDTTEFLVK